MVAGGSCWLPAPLGLVAGPQEATVDQVGRAGELAQDRGGVLVAGIVEDSGEELGSFPRRAPSSFGEQEPSPLTPGQVPLEQGVDLLFLVIEMVPEDVAELLGGRGHPDAAGQGGVDRPDGGRQAAVLGDHEVKLVQILGLGQMASQGTVALSRNVPGKPSKVEAFLHGRTPRKGRTTRPCL